MPGEKKGSTRARQILSERRSILVKFTDTGVTIEIE